METKFNFKSQICTTREQSERLLSLGLMKETADCCWIEEWGYDDDKQETFCTGNYFVRPIDYVWDDKYINYIPAWSLHRLIEMMPPSIRKIDHYGLIYDIHKDWVCYMSYAQGRKCPYNKIFFESQNTKCYDAFIDCIEWLIKEGYFPKEYLV